MIKVKEQMALISCLILTLILSIVVSIFVVVYKHLSLYSTGKVPQGTFGLPIIGETIQFLSGGWKGRPQRFMERIAKFSTKYFKTNVLGTPMVVLCGAAGNKFLFCNEGKLDEAWWPDFTKKLFPLIEDVAGGSKRLRMLAPQFPKPEGLRKYIGRMDVIARRHFDYEWDNKDQVDALPLSR
ncbi:hypothetical protein Drorol1_Dr00008340, partial [Drosera rotundifolia]